MIRNVQRFALCMVLFLLGACSDDNNDPGAPLPTAATVDIATPAAGTMVVGSTLQLSVTVRDASGALLSDRPVAWVSSNASVISVSSTGLITAVADGTAAITAVVDDRTDGIALTAASAHSMAIAAPTYSIEPGAAVQLKLRAQDKAGNELSITPSWKSNNPDVASVSDSGLVRGLVAGQTSIQAIVGTATTTMLLSVQSPVRNKIAFITERGPPAGVYGSPRGGIYVMDLDGGNQQLLIQNELDFCSPDPPYRDYCITPWHKPAWNKDGMRIATWSDNQTYAPEWWGPMVFLCGSAPGSACGTLDPFPSRAGPFGYGFGPLLAESPAWSPDGKQLAFFGGLWDPASYSFSSSGGDEPSWSPDGGQVAIVRWPQGSQTSDIYIRNVTDTTDPVRLTDAAGDDRTPQWSINGKIAFVSNRDGNREIYVMNPDGTGQTNVTNNSADDASPSWSPDGSRLVFHTNRDGNYEIYSMLPDGSGLVNLTNNPAADTEPAWSP